ncbi:1-deoxy-D-xylulose-5-phosphate reductoisomerase [SAR202 cluster bacterium AC-409-J13_OGT_754m]|nr:1-deoxy-D-xylulose-5-phosphate reductoisomerase [SAR202 cluster bacterium AC-409-J13_OGT_754m]
MAKKRLVVLGSTGSIGRQTLDIIKTFPDKFELIGLAAGNNVHLLESQIEEFQPKSVYCIEPSHSIIKNKNIQLMSMEQMVSQPNVDIVMVATSGNIGLIPTIKALEKSITVCIANKEVIIMAGELIKTISRKSGALLLPVDSEPSAIWQCMQGESQPIRRIILTASGGPFYNIDPGELDDVTPKQALQHPTWNMGKRITVDSSTLMNKGFEVIEAHILFDVGFENIEVMIHPQSLIHSMIELTDGSIKAQISPPDMRLPIQHALFYPEKVANPMLRPFDTHVATNMELKPLDKSRYPCFTLAVSAGIQGGTYPTVLTAADEVAVDLFLNHRISFTDIPRLVDSVLFDHKFSKADSLENIQAADRWARLKALALAGDTQ